jgi:hypothetical protein
MCAPCRRRAICLVRVVVFAVSWSLIVCAAACRGQSTSADESKLAKPAPPSPLIGSDNPPKDESLSVLDYVRRGVPDSERPWMGQDMTLAFEILSTIAKQSPRQLPRYQSKRSGATFARLTAAENLKLFRDRTVPLQVRFQQSFDYVGSLNQIFKLYYSAFLKKAVSDSEVLELIGAQLRASVMTLDLIDELLPTLRKDDPRHSVRMDALKGVKDGLSGAVAGALIILTEKEAYRASERVRLIEHLKETLPQLLPRLASGAQTETLVRLERMTKDPGLKDLQPPLGQLYRQVQALLKRTETLEQSAKERGSSGGLK